MTDKYRLMRAEKGNYPVKMMARVLKVSRSGFYGWLAKGEPEDPWAELRAEVKRVWLESDRTFGARFVLAFLPEGFSGATLYRVRKCMRELGIRGIAPNSKKRTTIPDEGAPARPDLVKRDFTSLRRRMMRTTRMNTKSRSQNDSEMCQRLQKSFMSTLRNGARKFAGTLTPSAAPTPMAMRL